MTAPDLAAMTTEAIRDHLTQIDAELRRRQAGAVEVLWWAGAFGPEAPGPTPEEYAAAGFTCMSLSELFSRFRGPAKEARDE